MRLLKFISFTLIFLIGNSLQAQTPWTIVPTTESHAVKVVMKNLTPDLSKTVGNGDYVAFFYESTPGIFLCAGATRYIGVEDTLKVTVYGNDGIDSGFALGESLRGRIWDSTQNCQTDFASLIFSFGPSVYITGATSIINTLDADAPRLDYENTIFHKSNNLLIPAELLNSSPTEITNVLIKNTSSGLTALDSAVIDLSNSDTGEHYITFSSDQCLFEDSLNLSIIDVALEWEFQSSQSSHHTFLIDSSTLASTENIEGTQNAAIQIGDIIGVFYDSLAVKYCAGYSVYDGKNMSIRANGYTEGINGGFHSLQQTGTLERVYFELYDSENSCTKHNTRVITNDNEQHFYYPDSFNIITNITFSPDTSFNYPQNEYLISEFNPILNVPTTFTSWYISGSSDGLAVFQDGEIDLESTTSEQHYITLEATECMSSDSVFILIITDSTEINNNETTLGNELILAPTSEDKAYHSILFPNKGKIDILDRNGLLIKTLNGPTEWFGDGNGIELPSGDYFVQCEDGAIYLISIIK